MMEESDGGCVVSNVNIPWAPRVILAGRLFRLPVVAEVGEVGLEAGDFEVVDYRWSERDGAFFYYLKAPEQSGSYTVRAEQGGEGAQVQIQVRSLDELRQPHHYNGAQWPRRWPLGRAWESTKRGQTLQGMPIGSVNAEALRWWTGQEDAVLWRQLPPAELPKAHFVNAHQGCPSCGTAIFTHGGFYPWKRRHLPADFRSQCAACEAVFPSNDLSVGDFIGGTQVDDGYGYFDQQGNIYLFAATYCRDQTRAFGSAIGLLTSHLRTDFDQDIARQLALMLLRYAVEEIYLAAVPQFRYGPSKGVEEPWDWGQPDWTQAADPVAALNRQGTVRYSIDTPYISETLALAYDTVWPLLRQDTEIVERARACGLEVEGPAAVVCLIEEMLASLLHCAMDGGAASNLPRVSEGVLVLLRALDRADAQEVMTWLYERGPDKLRVFGINNFFPDGTPPESTGGYNNIHSNGLFALEYHLRQLRDLHPQAYLETEFPSLMADPRAARVALAPHEITALGKAFIQLGDGSAAPQAGRYADDLYHAPLAPETLEWAAEFTGDERVACLRDAVHKRTPRRLGTTIHDGVGIAVLRTGETPERAAVGIIYGDTTGHRHMDLLEVQFFAFGRPFLTDLGYPQSWASIAAWESHWATHNTVWGTVPGLESPRTAGRGRLLRTLFVEGIQILEVEAERWAWDGQRWYRPGVSFRRLLALVETDGEGVCLVDLTRVCGGDQHWRVCRGLEGDFVSDEVAQNERGGTIATAEGARGDLDTLSHPDYAALAYMDEVAEFEPRPSWKGSWVFRNEEGVFLDLHQLRTNAAQTLSARATEIMGKPEESNYYFRTLLWRSAAETTYVDLVFEPRAGAATVARATGIAADAASAAGVELCTAAGRQIQIYWAPAAGPHDSTHFADGTRLQGSLAVVADGEVAAVGATALQVGDKLRDFGAALRQGSIVALDRQDCSVVVTAIEGLAAGERIRINPAGRGHNYRIEEVGELEPGRYRIKLDVTTLLGNVRVVAIDGMQVELDFHIMARSGNLHGTRLQVGEEWAEIVEAHNPDTSCTVIVLQETVKGLKIGDWVSIVDCVVGDEVVYEPLGRSEW